MLNDARDAEVVIEEFNCVAHFRLLRFSKDIIDQYIIRPLKRSPSEIVKGSANSSKLLRSIP